MSNANEELRQWLVASEGAIRPERGEVKPEVMGKRLAEIYLLPISGRAMEALYVAQKALAAFDYTRALENYTELQDAIKRELHEEVVR